MKTFILLVALSMTLPVEAKYQIREPKNKHADKAQKKRKPACYKVWWSKIRPTC